MFGFLMGSSALLSLDKILISWQVASSILRTQDEEITPHLMEIGSLIAGIHFPEGAEGSEVITSSSLTIPAFFSLPIDESEFLREIEIWANLDGEYKFYSRSTDLVSRNIFAPRSNYIIKGYYQNNIANIEVKTSPIYSFPDQGIVAGAHNSLSELSIYNDKSDAIQFDSQRYFYTGISTQSYEDVLSELSIFSNDGLIADTERYFFTAKTQSDVYGIIDSVCQEIAILPSESLYSREVYIWSSGGILLE